jgi:UDP-2,3-diacylglucosamine pyrophosphatase LpxH
MYDAIIVSDIRLGSSNCQSKALTQLLEDIADGVVVTDCLILNGDVFDSFDFRRLGKHHWKVLSMIRKLSDQIKIIWICGNHDGSAEVVSHLLGVTVKDEFVFRSGDREILVLHGHTFDDFIDTHPILTWIGDCIYALLQWVDSSHTIARMAKKGSKTFVRCVQKIERGAIAQAKRMGCDVVCCGHTHLAVENPHDESGVQYFNSGCWTESPCTYLTIVDGLVQLNALRPSIANQPEPLAALAATS